ncbi:MAG: hypothetical protein K6B54_06715 [Clostridia bacterium]|nr:hypothetical protein [Clostridia bacterium]
MKIAKIAVLILTICSLLITEAIGVCAETTELTKSVAEELISEFIDIRNSMGLYFGWFNGGTSQDYLKNGNIPASDIAEGHLNTEMGQFCKYIKVKDGYGPEEVKQKIRSLFTSDLAEKIITDGESFFLRYYQEKGEWYYERYQGGRIYSYNEGDRQNTYFELSEVKNLVIIKSNEQSALVSVPVHRFYDENDGEKEEARLLTDVLFSLSFIDGKWKIAEVDFANMLFRADSEKTAQSSLTEETVREGVIALVSDLYSLTMLDAECRYDTYSPSYKDYRHPYKKIEGNVYAPMEGNLSDPATWYNYAEKFCSPEVAGYLLNHIFSNSESQIRVFGNSVYYLFFAEFNHYDPDRSEMMNTYSLKSALANAITIEHLSGTKAIASVSCTIKPQANRDSKTVTLTLEYEKGDDGWKIVNTGFIDTLDNEVYALRGSGVFAQLIPDRGVNPGTFDAGCIFALLVSATVALSVAVKKRTRGTKRSK